MNVQDYLRNPNGKGSSAVMVSEMRRILDEQYKNLHGTISVRWYKLSNQFLIAHVKVPSRSVGQLYYDVLLEFDIDTIPENKTVVNDGNVRVFSNCPSFTFTYAHTFDDNKNLITWCKKKYPREIFSKDPKKRNPSNIVNYEKSLYFAIKFILSEGRNYKGKIDLSLIKVKSHLRILDNIKSSDEVLEIYSRKKKKQEEKKKDAKPKEERTNQQASTFHKNREGGVAHTKKVSRVGKTKTVKKVKKI